MIDIFVINQVDYSIIVIGGAGTLIFFAMQFALCLKAQKSRTKRIPLYVLLFLALLCVPLGFGILGSSSDSVIDGNKIAALALACIVGIAAIGEILAWAVYGVIRYSRKRKMREDRL